jgi:hypothetical protein
MPSAAPLREGRRFCLVSVWWPRTGREPQDVSHIGTDMEQDDPLDTEGVAGPLAADRDGIDWDAIKRAVIHGDKSLARIAEEFGSSESTIRRRAKVGDWVRLVGTKKLPGGRRLKAPGSPRPTRGRASQVRRRKMVQRLFEVLDQKMRLLEERMANAQSVDSAPQSAADAERDTRSLNALARLYAKLVELDDAARKGGAGEGREPSDAMRSSDDADRLRRDLALRLQRLNQAGGA